MVTENEYSSINFKKSHGGQKKLSEQENWNFLKKKKCFKPIFCLNSHLLGFFVNFASISCNIGVDIELSLAPGIVHIADFTKDCPFCPSLVMYTTNRPHATWRKTNKFPF